jgi:Domain of unknown function (DUF4864)
MFCPKCGAPIDNDHSYCAQCGCSLEEWGVMSHHHPTSTSTQPRKKTASWFYVIVTLSFFLMIWGLYSFITGVDALSSTVKTQLAEIKSNKLTKAYYEYTSSEFRTKKTLDEFKKFIDENSALKNYQSVTIVKSERENKYGVVFADLLLPDNMFATITFEFVKEDDEWRILGITATAPKFVDEKGEGSDTDIVDAVKAHLDAMRKGEIDKAYAMGAKEFHEATKPEGFREFIKEYPSLTSEKNANMSVVEQEGNKALVRVLLFSNGEPVPVDYIMVSEGGAWKVWSLYVVTPEDDDEVNAHEITDNNISAPIEKFLQDLKVGQVEEAYDGTAEQFKNTISFDQFKKFLKKFPIFIEGEGISIKSKVSGQTGQARFEMKSEDQETVVDYTLSLEDNNWKIMGIQLVEEIAPKDEEGEVIENDQFDTSFLTKIISDQLEQMKQKDLYAAYEDFTSLRFRESTPFDSFARFVDQNSIFTDNQSIAFGDLTFNNNVATLLVVLTAEEKRHEKVEYDLIKEDEGWKILSIKIVNNAPQAKKKHPKEVINNKLVFDKIDVGTEVNLSGQITNPSTKIKSSASEIFATLFVKEGVTGTVIEVFFEHIDTGSSLPPVTKTLKDNGNSHISLVFSPPKEGWPKGKYLLKAKASSGQKTKFEFEIIE